MKHGFAVLYEASFMQYEARLTAYEAKFFQTSCFPLAFKKKMAAVLSSKRLTGAVVLHWQSSAMIFSAGRINIFRICTADLLLVITHQNIFGIPQREQVL